MKNMMQSGWAAAAAMSVVMSAAFGMTAAAQQTAAQAPAANPVKRVIVVSLEDRKLALIENGNLVKVYTVAVGKPSTPSPVGTFTIARRVKNPTYSHDGRVVPPGPGNPVGDRWMGLSIRGYGIHGTNAPNSIGKAASHGCIRMGKADIEDLFARVEVGDTVELVGTRNAQTAQLFGAGPEAAPAAAPETVAMASARTAPATAATNGSM